MHHSTSQDSAASSRSIAIIGGGISGLIVAYRLLKFSNNAYKITIIESESRLGGWIQSSIHDLGTVLEQGPHSMRFGGASTRIALNLISELGLEDSIVFADNNHPAVRKRFIYAKNKLHQLPSSILSLCWCSSLFSRPLIWTLLREWWLDSTSKDNDETVYQFFKRRFNTEIAEYLADPLCRGTQAGDARKLSMKSCFPQMYDYEQKYRSVVSGVIHARKSPGDESDSPLLQQAKRDGWRMWTLRDGLESLVIKLHQILLREGVEIKLNSPCTYLTTTESKEVVVHVGQEILKFDHAVCSLPARNLSTILPAEHAILAETLSQIENVTVVVVNLIYDKVFAAISGFGHLIPSCEDYRVLGIVYDSCSFPQLDSQLKVTTRFTVLIGGAWFDELQHENTDDNDYYLQIATDALKVHLGINLKPVDTKVSIQRDGIPQYTVGHSDRIEKIFHYINHHNLPLSLIGSSYKGISVCDCIFNASMAAEDIIKNSCYMD